MSFNQCPTVDSQLRLLEVFEGVSGRELVQVGEITLNYPKQYIKYLCLLFEWYLLTLIPDVLITLHNFQ